MARPRRKDLPAPDVRGFRAAVDEAMGYRRTADEPPIAATKWGVYAFYDFEGEPIYVGQTNERLSSRVRRHLTNQRTDAVGMRVLDPYEILDLELWPLPQYEATPSRDRDAKVHLNRLERTIYEKAIAESRFGAILNEKIPPDVPVLADEELPEPFRFRLVPEEVLQERMHPDNRIARRGETLSRLTSVVRERGEVTDGLRRVVIVQAARLAWLTSQRLAQVQGREPLQQFREFIRLPELVGGVTESDDDTETGADSQDDPDED